ncbi:hypothetical protein COB21_00180 [Candidatus Aerophobetes bacterium]|uniref:Uncharacterized protein n=1 Tax=Aerophobetes bacterium TaxID=2030807 RepID=A0A2A4X871_UNCAE|nr:MAG: hypothetical protein COB21_00180 [Candidatus Aerophobetes bacterium]
MSANVVGVAGSKIVLIELPNNPYIRRCELSQKSGHQTYIVELVQKGCFDNFMYEAFDEEVGALEKLAKKIETVFGSAIAFCLAEDQSDSTLVMETREVMQLLSAVYGERILMMELVSKGVLDGRFKQESICSMRALSLLKECREIILSVCSNVEKLPELRDDPAVNPEEIQEHLAKAKELSREKKYAQALAEYRHGLVRTEGVGAKQYGEMIQATFVPMKDYPNLLVAYLNLIMYFFQEGNSASAMDAIKAVQGLEASLFQSSVKIPGQILFLFKDLSLVFDELEALESRPHNVQLKLDSVQADVEQEEVSTS